MVFEVLQNSITCTYRSDKIVAYGAYGYIPNTGEILCRNERHRYMWLIVKETSIDLLVITDSALITWCCFISKLSSRGA